MTTIAIARKLAEYGKKEEAQKAYTLFLQQPEKQPAEELEAAAYLFFSGGDYRVSYTTLVSLYNRGFLRTECLDILTQGFYEPNKKLLQTRYEKNCKLLQKYPYLFRKDFLPFEDLPIRFYPYDDNGYVPLNVAGEIFGDYVNFNDPVIDRNFFHDLENPILAQDVYSQYQLEYLNDNVRKSEWVGRENHIYLHYTSWPMFCAYLQCLNLRPLLEEKKIVFLMEDEVSQYPIDFKERFGIDYSQYPVKPVGIREVNRLIWHTQLSSHNGGDFFNEILYDHPNVLSLESIMYDNLLNSVTTTLQELRQGQSVVPTEDESPAVVAELNHLSHVTEKDILVALFLGKKALNTQLDPNARIAPAIMLQPHFYNMVFDLKLDEKERYAILSCAQYEQIKTSPLFLGFKYIKTFTPLRRMTTSFAATVRFMLDKREETAYLPDVLLQRVLNRSFMLDGQDRLYRDSILVRFEDGKLNPKATFTALAAFLDIPYTKSMTYCSSIKGINPESLPGNARGFDPVTVYRTYDDYTDDMERALLEVLMADVYRQYGYDFHYYHNEAVDESWLENTLIHCDRGYELIRETYLEARKTSIKKISEKTGATIEENLELSADKLLQDITDNRRRIAKTLLRGLRFVNANGQPLRFMKQLKLDPALLEQPLYH